MLVEEYLPVAIWALLALGFSPLAWWMSRFVRPTKYSSLRNTTYECGSAPIGEARIQFRFQYYMFGIIFVVFDLVTVFLMIWAIAFSDLSDAARIWVLVFLGIMLLGVTYALKKEESLWI
jgi:NADH:ubiquinone oxidoreductase subunit 3 (subunit A)